MHTHHRLKRVGLGNAANGARHGFDDRARFLLLLGLLLLSVARRRRHDGHAQRGPPGHGELQAHGREVLLPLLLPWINRWAGK